MKAKGYENGREIELDLQPIGGGYFLEAKAAEDYLKMKAAAEAATGEELKVNFAFRNMVQQKILWAKREAALAAGEKFQLVARPGYSTHQSGRSLDLQLAAHPKLKEWLDAHCAEYNFKFDVASEGWHCTHGRQ